MAKGFWIFNARVVNEGNVFHGRVRVRDGLIEKVEGDDGHDPAPDDVDARQCFLLPGVIDDQVHFREPGMTHKEDIAAGARAAVAGGITSYMEMPNTKPPAVTRELVEEKYRKAARCSLANYGFFIGATNGNLDELLETDPATVPGIKVFMGASTGDLLVDNADALDALFRESPMLIATHCEDEATIRSNTEKFKRRFGADIPMRCHPLIRSEEACYRSSSRSVERAEKYGTRLHILHISTGKEVDLFSEKERSEKHVTAEACIHHLWFSDADYEEKGSLIKWNPAIKTPKDREMVFDATKRGVIDVIATDHAPHTLAEKRNPYLEAPSGGPLVQHSLVAMMEYYHRGAMSMATIVDRMAHAPADLFGVRKRGYIRPGFHADLVIMDPESAWTVHKENLLYKCGWSPFEGTLFNSRVVQTFVNGVAVYSSEIDEDGGIRHGFTEGDIPSQRLSFER